jgi:hypothetical protein
MEETLAEERRIAGASAASLDNLFLSLLNASIETTFAFCTGRGM